MIDEDNRYNELTDHIRSVFDEHEEPGADAGWALLRKKYPEEKSRGLAGWLWYAAAAVLLVFTGLWFLNKPDANKPANNVAHVKKMEPAKQNQSHDAITAPAPVTVPPVDSIVPRNQPSNSANLAVRQPSGIYRQPALGQQTAQGGSNSFNNNQTVLNKPDTAVNHNTVAVNKAVQDAAKTQGRNAAMTKNTVDSAQTNKQVQFAASSPVKQQNPVQQQQSSADAMKQLLANDSKQNNGKEKDKKNDKKALFGVYAATYFNYAKGSENKVNVGAGLSSDFKLTKRLRLSTGVAIAQNSLSYNSSSVSQGSSVSMLSAAGVYAAAEPISAGKSTVAPEAVNSNYNASLIGIDIPINLKFQFNPDKSDAYVAAGLSSGTFINETYTTNYNYGQNLQQSSSVTKNFSGFDLAKTLNLSFGMGYPLGKANRLIVEPFIKYPLDGLGSQQLKFGAGGVNLKLSFTGRK